jgi:hypothetical protein
LKSMYEIFMGKRFSVSTLSGINVTPNKSFTKH